MTVNGADNDNDVVFIAGNTDFDTSMVGGDGADSFSTGTNGQTTMRGGAGADTFTVAMSRLSPSQT